MKLLLIDAAFDTMPSYSVDEINTLHQNYPVFHELDASVKTQHCGFNLGSAAGEQHTAQKTLSDDE